MDYFIGEMKFTDISVEQWRQYEWQDGKTIVIENPLGLNVSASGGHRIESANGRGHYVPAGWIYLTWQVRENEPVFVA